MTLRSVRTTDGMRRKLGISLGTHQPREWHWPESAAAGRNPAPGEVMRAILPRIRDADRIVRVTPRFVTAQPLPKVWVTAAASAA